MTFKRTLVFLFAFILLMTTVASAQKSEKLPPIKYKEITLKNGLRVLLHEDHSTPIVAVNLWYHVGSKNETVGKTGFAHLFEHLMFQGSKHFDNDYFAPLQEAGANINGSTTSDRTNYYEVVPSNFLELALWLESDRMGYLPDAMTMEKLNNQRDVVKNEKRQNYDNRPYGLVGAKIAELMYPENHPYHWLTIGSLDDLTAASIDDVKAFFRQYYVPNNCTLVLAGDFNPKDAETLVKKYFEPIPRGADITRPNPPQAKLDREIRYTMEENVQLPRLYMAWHSVPQYTPDEAPLDMLSRILSSGRGSRLQSSLVYDKQISQDIGAYNSSREIAGQFQISSAPRPGKTTDEVEKEILAEIERIKNTPPTLDEMTRALNGYESSAIFGLQTVLGKADQLNSYATFVGKPDYFQIDLDRYRRVTPADVQRVAKTYLTDKRLVLNVVPRAKGSSAKSVAMDAANRPTSVSGKKSGEEIKTADKPQQTGDSLYTQPQPKADPKFALPVIEKSKLSNNLEVWLVRQNELPIVSMNMVFKTGSTDDPKGLTGLNDITSTLLDEGTKTRTAVEIANEIQGIGAQLFTTTNDDNSSVRILTLTKNFDKALDIYSDVIQNADFPNAEVETYRKRLLVSLKQRLDNPTAIAGLVYNKILYGENHPYGAALNEKSVQAIKRSDLENYYASFYRPNNAVLIVVGDVEMNSLKPKLEKAFGNWKAGEITQTALPDAPKRSKAVIYLVDKPGAAQSVINIGQVGVARSSPDYFPLQVLNTLLGGSFARLDMNLRENKGYTYGARSSFAFRRGAGPFTASAPVQTAVTKESVVEFLKEINGVRGSIPITQKELEYNKERLIRGYPRNFETVDQIASQLSSIVTYDLPDTYFNDYIARVNAVTLQDVNRVAQKYLTPNNLAILIVGDRKLIEPGLKEIEGLGNSIVYLDAEGNPVK